MNRPDQHPDTEWLDQLRAGLLDDNPARKSALETHLKHCAKCQELHTWPDALVADSQQADRLKERLDRARQQALARPAKTPLRRLVPFATAAAIALIAIVSVNQWQQTQPAQTQVAKSTNGEVPEVYEDLDFYLWLADHKASSD
jgi:hypothetical protein